MNSARIVPLLRRAESREDALAKLLATKVQAHQQQAERLGDLQRFRGEYEQAAAPGAALTPGLLQNRTAFLAKIDDAVQTQKKHVSSSEEALSIERTRLLLASRDKLVLEKLAASYRCDEQRVEDRRAQSVQDDLGARAHTIRTKDST